MSFAAFACPSGERAVNQGAVMVRQIEVQERVAGSSARNATPGVAATHSATAARLASLRAISAGSPPIASAQARASSTSATHSREGC